jgi:hypothetical protein
VIPSVLSKQIALPHRRSLPLPHYKLVSSRGDIVAQIDGVNAACALALASDKGVEELHVYQDDAYLFTLKGGQDNCWMVQTKPGEHVPVIHSGRESTS